MDTVNFNILSYIIWYEHIIILKKNNLKITDLNK